MKYLILLALILSPLQIFAQSFPSAFDETAELALTPKIPAPEEEVLVKVSSSNYSSLDRSNIIWSVDGVVKKRGIGEKTFQFQSPKSGRSSTVSVRVERDTGGVLNESATITPSDLDLIYEANTYVPPFYKGRSLFTHESTITMAAMAIIKENGVPLPKNKIIYTWLKDDGKMPELSGVGRDSAQITGSLISRPFYVSVIAESLNSNLKAKKTILINPTVPQVVLYENNPIYGSIFEKALTGEFNFDREEVGITAIPYFFSTKDRNSSSLKYSWYENGRSIGDATFGSFINYLNPDKLKSGVSVLAVQVEHLENLLQSGNNSFKVNVIGNQQFDTIKNDVKTAF